MPKKKKDEIVEETKPEEITEEVEEISSVEKPEVKVEEKPKRLPKGMVKVKVLIGTLQFEAGIFEKGSIIEVSRKQLKKFDPTSVEILK